MVRQCLALRLVERRGSTALDALFWSFARFEARDLLILSVTRALLHRSEHVAPHWIIRAISHAVRGCVKLPVMMRPRGVGCVRITRAIMPGHGRQSVAPVATLAAIAATVAAGSVPAAPTAPATVADGPVTAATTVATAPATVADGPVTAAAALASGLATITDEPVTA